MWTPLTGAGEGKQSCRGRSHPASDLQYVYCKPAQHLRFWTSSIPHANEPARLPRSGSSPTGQFRRAIAAPASLLLDCPSTPFCLKQYIDNCGMRGLRNGSYSQAGAVRFLRGRSHAGPEPVRKLSPLTHNSTPNRASIISSSGGPVRLGSAPDLAHHQRHPRADRSRSGLDHVT